MEMEKACEFCMLLKPVVYCEADAAHLCLSCDAKVHSANALSNRHPRTLVCECCGHNPAYIRCSDHQTFMCHDCDRRHHDLSSQHKKKRIPSYVGSPSAKDLAALWGFCLKDLENATPVDQFISTSNGKVNGAKVTSKIFKRSHSSPGGSSLASELDFTGLVVSSESESSLDLGPELQDWGSTHESPVAESFPLPLPDGDSFWECKSPVQSSQLWPQNLQDLGAYAELECFDNSNMPDVDLTFQNFEELFGEEQDLNNTLLEEDMTCSSMENDSSIDRSDYSYVKKDTSTASLVRTGQSTHFGQGHGEHIPTIKDCPPPIRTNFSSLSFSASRLSSESSGNEYVDSPAGNDQEVSCNSQKEDLLARHKEKKKARLSVFRYEKQARNTPRRARTTLKKQPIRGQVLKSHCYESDALNMSQSF